MTPRSPNGWSKQQVLNWFGDRGVHLKWSELKRHHWAAGRLYFVVETAGRPLQSTAAGLGSVDVPGRDWL